MRWLAAVVLTLVAGACGPAMQGKLRAGGYRHELLPVGVRTTAPSKVEFVSPEWRVANFEPAGGEWKRRKGDDNDLSLEHKKSGAAIFLRVEILSEGMAERTLDALARDRAETLGGKAMGEKKVETRVVSSGATRVGDRDAYQATVDLVGRRSARLLLVVVETGYRMSGHGRALVLLGLLAEPRDFEASLPDFGRFVDELELGPGAPSGYRRD